TSIAVANGAVAYLVSPNQAFLFSTDSSVVSGFGEPQAAMSFTNSALNGNYAGVAATPASFGVQVFSGEFAADGASPTGNMTGTVRWSASRALEQRHVSSYSSFQRDGHGWSHERDVHGQHQRRHGVNHGHHLRGLRGRNQDSFAHRESRASPTAHAFLADAESQH